MILDLGEDGTLRKALVEGEVFEPDAAGLGPERARQGQTQP